ncbi:hypothetical protein FACS18942_05310 [Planctomycetales bacterium]|nr:hypothetical protein FACS18942_05310 [Planctomycetales bacterium]
MNKTSVLLLSSLPFFLLYGISLFAEENQLPPNYSGIYPHLTQFNNETECGTGAVVPWADRLWTISYGPHLPLGSSDKLYEITPDLKQIIRPESVGGTHANRFIHKESNQLIIGLHFIDKDRNVRTIEPKKMPGRQTGNARHLSDPAGKIYYATMEEGLYEVDVKTLAVNALIKDGNKNEGAKEDKPATFSSKLPGYHGKGFYSGFKRLVYSNNGDNNPKRLFDPTIDSGALAEWFGEGDWQLVRRNQFTEVSGPGGIYGNANPNKDPIWSIGWDYRSLILMVLSPNPADNNKPVWTAYRLPKASHTYDGAHGWHTEWPRIRDINEEQLLMIMHGTFWKFPKTFTPQNSAGIVPRSTYLKIIGDFCEWNGKIVCGCDDSAKSEFTNKRKVKGDLAGPGQSQSNLWFVEHNQLDNFGPVIGRGGPWEHDDLKANTVSEPYLFAGYDYRTLYLKHKNSEPVSITIEVDETGSGNWKTLETVNVPAAGLIKTYPKETAGIWLRFKTANDVSAMTAFFQYRNDDNRSTEPDKIFDGLAKPEDKEVNGGVMLARGSGFKTLRFVAQNGKEQLGCYDLAVNEQDKLTLQKQDDSAGEAWTAKNAAIPAGVLDTDDASVLLIDEKGRWRMPFADGKRQTADSSERVCREVATERDLFYAGGIFYELPAENSGGVQKIRPIASHNFRIKDYCSYRGMLVISGLSANASTDNSHIIKSDDGKCALWCGVIDDLWKLGKPRGIGGVWKNTAVKAGEPSDPYLMSGYDKKSFEISHNASKTVKFRIELDVCGNGDWTTWKEIEVKDKTGRLEIPIDAYWVRAVSDADTDATLMFYWE